jgi:3-oxoacyl-[acyl-carrier protein] reductase
VSIQVASVALNVERVTTSPAGTSSLGVGSGIGAAISLRLAKEGAKEGAKIAVLDVNMDGARAVTSMFGGLAIHADVSDSSAVNRAIDEAEAALGPIDVRVNNAGISTQGSVERLRDGAPKLMAEVATGAAPTTKFDATVRMPDEEWIQMLTVNLFGVFYCTRRALQTMQERNSGSIGSIASVGGIEGCVGHPRYSASKGGILAFTRSVAKEVISYGIRVNAVTLGLVDIPMAQAFGDEILAGFKLQFPQGRLETPDEIAATVAFLVTRPRTSSESREPERGIDHRLVQPIGATSRRGGRGSGDALASAALRSRRR